MTAPSAADTSPKAGFAVMTVALCWLVALCEAAGMASATIIERV